MSVRPRGAMPGWEPTTPRQKAILADLQARYWQHALDGTLPRGGRGMFYDLRPHGMGNGVTYTKHPAKLPNGRFDPMTADPKAVQDVLVLSRRAGIIPEEDVADTRAPAPYTLTCWADADGFAAGLARAAREQFRLDPQHGQPVYVEVLCEAEDLSPRLARVALRRGVHVYSGGGFDGLKAKRAFAQRAADRDVPTVVLVVTDLDDHGLRIFRAAAEDAAAWVPHERPDRAGDWLTFQRIAVTEDQARTHDLLDDDGKAEADGVPVQVLDRILLDAIDELHDPAVRKATEQQEDQERARLGDAIRAALDGTGTEGEDQR